MTSSQLWTNVCGSRHIKIYQHSILFHEICTFELANTWRNISFLDLEITREIGINDDMSLIAFNIFRKPTTTNRFEIPDSNHNIQHINGELSILWFIGRNVKFVQTELYPNFMTFYYLKTMLYIWLQLFLLVSTQVEQFRTHSTITDV